MKVDALLQDIDAKIDNTASIADKLSWVNTFEQSLYRSIIKEPAVAYMDVVADQDTYDISDEAYSFEDIEAVIIDEIPYQARTLFVDGAAYYTYAKSGTNLIVSPTPVAAKTDGIEIRYIRKPTIKTATNMSTEDLDLAADFGEEFIDMYKFYCYREACIRNREFSDANSWATLYNEREAEFFKWHQGRQPRDMANYRKRHWR
jgi:hypothetical protein